MGATFGFDSRLLLGTSTLIVMHSERIKVHVEVDPLMMRSCRAGLAHATLFTSTYNGGEAAWTVKCGPTSSL